MTILLNSLIRFDNKNDDKKVLIEGVYRVIYTDLSNIRLFNINVNAPDPETIPFSEIQNALSAGQATMVSDDPFAGRRLISEHQIPEKILHMRDFAHRIVVSIVYQDDSINLDVFDPSKRKLLIRKAAIEFGISEKSILRYLRKFWRGGMSLDAMTPNYENCGSPGKPHNHTDMKIGPNNVWEEEFGKTKPLYDGETTRMIMYIGLEKYKKGRAPLTFVREKILEEYYCSHWEKNEQGIETPILVEPDSRLTMRQLQYYYSKEWKRDPEKWLKNTIGERRFNLSSRALLGNSTLEAYAPGSIYQLDSTPLDINVVLTMDPFHVIGCPNLYVLSDVFSRSAAGFFLTMENASWDPCRLALDNAFNDKVQFCLEYGRSILPCHWPAHGFSEWIRADNAEMKSLISNSLVGVGIGISNTAPYRPDWKGIIERWFELLNRIVSLLPGGRIAPKNRGDSDSRLVACLTPFEITQILIDIFLYYNNHHLLKNYPRDEDLIKDNVPMIPNVLWAWGVKNRGSKLREEDRDVVMMSLLPHGQASITEAGFLFKGKKYHSGLPDEERLCVIARNTGRTRFPVVYDPRRPDKIFCQLNERAHYTPLSLSDEFKPFCGLHEMEWNEQELIDQRQSHILSGQEEQAKVDLNVSIKSVVDPAEKRTSDAVHSTGKSKHARIANMRENRRLEVDRERSEKVSFPDPKKDAEIHGSNDAKKVPEDKSWYIPRSTHTDLIAEIDEETNGHE